jgi:hypothetical protein
MCKLTVTQRTIESKTNMQYIFASTPLWNTSHTIMCHDTTIVLEHSFKYRKSIYYSLVTPSKSSYPYIDLQYTNDLEYVLHVRFTFWLYRGTLSCAMCFIKALTLYDRTNHVYYMIKDVHTYVFFQHTFNWHYQLLQ